MITGVPGLTLIVSGNALETMVPAVFFNWIVPAPSGWPNGKRTHAADEVDGDWNTNPLPVTAPLEISAMSVGRLLPRRTMKPSPALPLAGETDVIVAGDGLILIAAVAFAAV